MIYEIKVENMNLEIEVGELTGGTAQITVNGKPYKITIENRDILTAPVQTSPPAAGTAAHAGAGSIVAPIPGLILDIMVKVGDRVEAGDTVVIMEAMKMENNLVTDTTGIVREINVQKGARVNTGDLIMIIG